jgi:hypothetical protein
MARFGEVDAGALHVGQQIVSPPRAANSRMWCGHNDDRRFLTHQCDWIMLQKRPVLRAAIRIPRTFVTELLVQNKVDQGDFENQ